MYNVLNITFKDIILQNSKIPFQIGYIDPNTKYLTNIENSIFTIEVVEGECDIFLSSNPSEYDYILPYNSGTVVFKISYLDVSLFVSIYVIPARIFPQQIDILKLLFKYLPNNCYTSQPKSVNYTKLFATAHILANLYFDNTEANMISLFNNIYPPFSNSTAWEQNLNNNYPWADSYDYSHVIQLVKNLRLYSSSTYNSSRLISEYIYYRFERAIFVTIIDNNSPYGQAWNLGTSQLGINTTLSNSSNNIKSAIVYLQDDSSFYTTSILTELTIFIEKIFPVDVDFIIEIIPDLSTLSLTIDIGDVYNFDPRIFGLYAIKYNEDAVYKTQALVSPYNPAFIVSMTIGPPSFTMLPNAPVFDLSATIIYSYQGGTYTQDVTNSTTFSSSNSDIISVAGHVATPGGIEGIVTITGIYTSPLGPQFDLRNSMAYYVNSDLWSIGNSQLGVDTTLG